MNKYVYLAYAEPHAFGEERNDFVVFATLEAAMKYFEDLGEETGDTGYADMSVSELKDEGFLRRKEVFE